MPQTVTTTVLPTHRLMGSTRPKLDACRIGAATFVEEDEAEEEG